MSVHIYHGPELDISPELKQSIKQAIVDQIGITTHIDKLIRQVHKLEKSVCVERHGVCPITSTHAKEAYPGAELTAWITLREVKADKIHFVMIYF